MSSSHCYINNITLQSLLWKVIEYRIFVKFSGNHIFLFHSLVQEGEDESDAELQRAPQEVTIDRSAEKPPSYDVAVVKPPPYDLQFHLTPKERHSGPPKKPQHFPNAERCPIPDTVSTERWTPSHTVDESENDVLPSYHDAMKLSLRNDSDGRDQRNGESS